MKRSEKFFKHIDDSDARLWSEYNGTLVLLRSYSESLIKLVDKQKAALQAMPTNFTFDLIIQDDRGEDCNDIDFILEKLNSITDQLKSVKAAKRQARRLCFAYHKQFLDMCREEELLERINKEQ